MLYLIATCVFSVTIVNSQVSDRCNIPLGMKNGEIQDSQLRSSRAYTDKKSRLNYDVTEGRLDGQSCWRAKKSDKKQWIQVDFGTPMYVSGIILQGSPYTERSGRGWVTAYKAQYEFDSSKWQNVKDENQNDMIFQGNSDRNSHVTSLFTSAVRVTRIRIRPTAWNNHISMRFEILGCEDINECSSNPCENGLCANGVNQYRCTCNAGWSGTNCDQNTALTTTINAAVATTNTIEASTSNNISDSGSFANQNSSGSAAVATNAAVATTINAAVATTSTIDASTSNKISDSGSLANQNSTGSALTTTVNAAVATTNTIEASTSNNISDSGSFDNQNSTGSVAVATNAAVATTINAAVATTSTIEASTSTNISDSGSLANQNSTGSASTAIGVAIACVLLLVIICCFVVVKRRRQQEQQQERCKSQNVLQLDGPYGDMVININTSQPTKDTLDAAGLSGANGDTVARQPTEELYQDVLDKPSEGQQYIDKTYQDITKDAIHANQGTNDDDIYQDLRDNQDITEDVNQANPSKNDDDTYQDLRDNQYITEDVNQANPSTIDDDTYQDVRDNEYAYAHVDTERDTEPGVDGDLVQVYARSQYGGVPCSAEDITEDAIQANPAIPPTEELYQDVLDKPSEVQQDIDETYQAITDNATQSNQGTDDDDIYQDVQDNEYAYAHVDTERDTEPGVDDDLVQVYARSQYGGVPCSAENITEDAIQANPAIPPTEELYQDVLDKPSEVQQDIDETYQVIADNATQTNDDDIYQDVQDNQDITEEVTQANQGKNDDNIYQDLQDNEYAYAHVDTERDTEPGVGGDLVQIYARSQYDGVPYTKSDNDQQPKRQIRDGYKEGGLVENDIYARSDEDQPIRQGGEDDKAEGWMDNSIYATTDE